MSRKLSRLVLVASVAAGFLAPMAGAGAADPTTRGVDVHADRFEVPGATISNRLDLHVGEWVRWTVWEGTHTVTPVDKKQWGSEGSGDIDAETDYTAKNFNAVGNYEYYCKYHSSIDESGKRTGMWGFVRVTDPMATTTTTPAATPPSTSPPATQPPPTVTTRPGTPQTTVPPASSAGTHTPRSAGPAPTTTTAGRSGDKDKNKKPPKEEETTTTTVAPAPPPPVDIPAEAIIPSLPGSDTASHTEVQEGVLAEVPGDTPEGEAIALLKSKRSGNGMKLLIVSGIGLGVLGLGTAGYKFANRSSKYFPA